MWAYTVFYQVLNMSLTAAIVILFVLPVRLLLKRAPKIFSYALWTVVLFRLVCPVSFSSQLSLLGFLGTTVTEKGGAAYIPENTWGRKEASVPLPASEGGAMDDDRLPTGQERPAAAFQEAAVPAAAFVWLSGMAIMLVSGSAGFIRLCRRLSGAVPFEKVYEKEGVQWEGIYISGHIPTPFVLGFLHPGIYLPSGLSAKEQQFIIAHEKHHIWRLDHVVKILACCALCIHWFNPLVWLAFMLASRDMEMSCDEAVIRKLGAGIRADYSASLLSLATGRRFWAGMPLAFGEGDTKSRIRNVADWKKPGPLTVSGAAVVCCVALVICISNPWEKELSAPAPFGHSYRVEYIAYEDPVYSFTYSPDTAPMYCLTADYGLMEKEENGNWKMLGGMNPVTLSAENFDAFFLPGGDISGWRDSHMAKELREENQKAWLYIDTEAASEDPVLYYVLLQKDGGIYLAYGYCGGETEPAAEIQKGAVRWLFQLDAAGSCIVSTSGGEVEARHYPDGNFGFRYEELPVVTADETDTLLFQVDWEGDTLTVGEDYYEYTDGAGICRRAKYELERNQEGVFALKVRRRGDVREEYAVYYIMNGKEKHVAKVVFPL